MTLEYAFNGIRVIEDTLIPTKWKMKISLLGGGDVARAQGKDPDKSSSEAYQRLNYWLDLNLPNIIITDLNNEFGVFVANNSGNVMMYCPGEPADDLIIRLLHAKLTALCDNKLIIIAIQMKAKDVSASYTYTPNAGDYQLVATTKELYTQPALHEKPWWFRNDGFTFEFLLPEGSSETVDELFKDIFDPLNDFAADWDEDEMEVEVELEPAPVTKWKPKKV